MSESGWIGVDLDGTLAFYDKWRGVDHIGEPIPVMVERVKGWLSEGKEVKIFTARISHLAEVDRMSVATIIRDWCEKHVGRRLEVVCYKDFGMIELWDDRCVQVITNTGEMAAPNVAPQPANLK